MNVHISKEKGRVKKKTLLISVKPLLMYLLFWMQVCDSDTMLDPASSVEMVKVLEEDHMVGGVGGDVQVCVLLQF